MGRNTVEGLLTDGKVIAQITIWVQISLNIFTEKKLSKKNKQTENVKTNILTNTPLIFLDLEKRNMLMVLHTKIPKFNDKKNIAIVVKMLYENDSAPTAMISISFR